MKAYLYQLIFCLRHETAEWNADPDHFIGGLRVGEDKIKPYLLNGAT